MKKCSKCFTEKEESCFSWKALNVRRRSECRECEKFKRKSDPLHRRLLHVTNSQISGTSRLKMEGKNKERERQGLEKKGILNLPLKNIGLNALKKDRLKLLLPPLLHLGKLNVQSIAQYVFSHASLRGTISTIQNLSM